MSQSFRPAGLQTARGVESRSRAINLFTQAFILTIGTLFTIMNPFSTAPLFLALTAGCDQKWRNRQALLACIYSFGILVVFLLLGSTIIGLFGISVPGVRVAGGLIISVIGFRMLFPPPVLSGSLGPDASPREIAFTPLAMPSLAGPGSIAVVLTAAAQIRDKYPDAYELIYSGVIAGMAVTLLTAYVILWGAGAMARFLGPAGIDAMTRIFGFLLIAIGMQFLLSGISDFFGLPRT